MEEIAPADGADAASTVFSPRALHPATVIGVLSAVGVAVFAGAVTSTYALADDYFNVTYVSTPGNTFLGSTIGSGRAVSGLIQYAVLGLLESVEALGYIRLVGVVGVLTAAAACYFVLTRLGLSSVVALGCGAALVAMPSSIVVGVWATMFPVAFACAVALVAAAIAVRPPASSWRRTIGHALAAGLLVVLALQTYQPAATAYWAVVAAAVLLDPSAPRSWISAVLRAFVVFVAALAVYVLSVRISLAMGALEPTDERRLIIDPVEKLWWFVTDVLPLSLNPLSLSSRPVVAGMLAVVVLIGIYLRTYGSEGERVARWRGRDPLCSGQLSVEPRRRRELARCTHPPRSRHHRRRARWCCTGGVGTDRFQPRSPPSRTARHRLRGDRDDHGPRRSPRQPLLRLTAPRRTACRRGHDRGYGD